MKYMIIDIGSNSVKYDIFQTVENDFIKVGHRARVMGFLNYLDNRILSEKGFLVLKDILENFKISAEVERCDKIYAFATASLRSCDQPQKIIDRIKKETGIDVTLFSGLEEGEMSFLGAIHSNPKAENGVMFDMGGGSTEINIFENRKSIFLKSMPFGALYMKNNFANRGYKEYGITAFATKNELNCIYDHAYKTLCFFDIPKCSFDNGYMVGGSAKFVGMLCASPDDLGVTRFTKSDLNNMIDNFSSIDQEKASYLIENVPERYLLVIPAAVSYKAIFDYMGIEKLTVSTGGIRDGYMSKILKQDSQLQC